jgi:nitrite reductase (NO-forming)
MTPLNYLNDEDVANVLTYVRNSWGNSGEPVTPQEVSKVRAETPPPAQNNFE